MLTRRFSCVVCVCVSCGGLVTQAECVLASHPGMLGWVPLLPAVGLTQTVYSVSRPSPDLKTVKSGT